MGSREIRLSRAQQAWVYISFAILFASGAAWLGGRYYFNSSAPVPGASSPLSALSLKIHGGAAMAFLIVLGSLIPGHFFGGWKARKNISTGLPMIALNIILILTAYALYYVGSDELRAISSWIHIAVGILCAPLLIWHVYKHPLT